MYLSFIGGLLFNAGSGFIPICWVKDFVSSSKVLYSQHQDLIRLSNSAACLAQHDILFTIIINGEGRKIRCVGNAFFSQGYTHQALSDDTFGIEYGFITRHTVGQQFH